MEAMVLEEYGRPLVRREFPDPRPGEGEVLLRVRACGVCGTDVKISAGRIPTAKPPLVMGHEPAGEIVELGPGVQGFSPGDRVVVWIYVTCGACRFCRAGRAVLCPHVKRVGFERPGGFADLLVVPAANLVRVPDSLGDVEAAVLGCAVSTVYRALRTRAGVQRGETVMVMGVGGLGIHGVQMAKLSGATVIAVDVEEARLELARAYGADEVLLFRGGALGEQVRSLTGGYGADVILETVGLPETVRAAMSSLVPGGRLVMVGYHPAQPFSVESPELVLNEVEIVGSRAMTRDELAGALDLVASGKLQPVVTARYPLHDVNEVLDLLRQGRVMGRAVVIHGPNPSWERGEHQRCMGTPGQKGPSSLANTSHDTGLQES